MQNLYALKIKALIAEISFVLQNVKSMRQGWHSNRPLWTNFSLQIIILFNKISDAKLFNNNCAITLLLNICKLF